MHAAGAMLIITLIVVQHSRGCRGRQLAIATVRDSPSRLMDAEQRALFRENGYLVIKDCLSPATVAQLNRTFEEQLRDEKPDSAITWHLDRERDTLQPDGSLSARRLYHNDLILPPKLKPVLTELCSSFEFGHLHPECPPDKVGRFRLDLDGAHWIGPWPRPAGTPEHDEWDESIRRANPWTEEGIIQGGLHGGQPLFHISCLYELAPVGPGDGGFGCLAGSHLAGSRIGPHNELCVNNHFDWGKPPFTPDVDPHVTKVEGQPGDCVLFTERLVHSTLPWKVRALWPLGLAESIGS